MEEQFKRFYKDCMIDVQEIRINDTKDNRLKTKVNPNFKIFGFPITRGATSVNSTFIELVHEEIAYFSKVSTPIQYSIQHT